MAIMEYNGEAGKTFWKAYVSIKSKLNPSIRVQKWKFNLENRKQAEREEKNLLKECQAEVLKKENQGEIWGSLVDSWELSFRNDSSVSPTTIIDSVAAIRNHTSTWFLRPASEIGRADVIEIINQLKAGGASASYQRRIKTLIKKVFEFGIDNRVIKGMDRSPTGGIQLARMEEKKPEILTNDELKQLLFHAKRLNHSWFPVWYMAILTGLRNGELYALLWEDIDFLNREIMVNKSYTCRFKKVKSTKAGYWRAVPISNELFKFLKELKCSAGSRLEVLPRLPRWNGGDQARILREFCLGIGLRTIKFHTLRACFATQLIRNGVPPIQIQKICGWKDLETMQRYIRLAGIEIKGATESLRILSDDNVLNEASDNMTLEL